MVYFNSHAHVERDNDLKFVDTKIRISTHTLTWSVTCFLYLVLNALIISTHTLTWSVTTSKKRSQRKCRNFNSHAHVERDEYLDNAYRLTLTISTHTLTWSVTGEPRRNLCGILHFNSHAHVERDVRQSLSCTL